MKSKTTIQRLIDEVDDVLKVDYIEPNRRMVYQFFKEKLTIMLDDEEHLIKQAFREGCWKTGHYMTEDLAELYYEKTYGI
jgi:hypothetical protein